MEGEEPLGGFVFEEVDMTPARGPTVVSSLVVDEF